MHAWPYALFCAAFGITGAMAQTAPDAGAVQREQQRRALEAPGRLAPPVGVEQPTRPAMPASATRFLLNGIRISGNTAFSEAQLQPLVQDIVGKEVGLSDLEEAAARISRHFRERGYMVARAYLPAQDIRDGIVEIVVIEGRFGRVEVKNSSRLGDAAVQRHVQSIPGNLVFEPALERELLLFNDLSGVGEARASLRPGAKVGESDMDVELSAAPMATGSLEYDNHGNRFVGTQRLSGQFNLASPLGLGDLLSARATKGFSGLEHGRISYLLPLGGDGLKAGWAYGATRYELGKTFAPLLAHGHSSSHTLHVSYPFMRTNGFSLYARLALDMSDLQDRVDSTATVTDKNTRSATLALFGDSRDALGGGGINQFSLAYSSGRLEIETPAALAIDAASARTHGNYDKLTFNVQRLQALGERTVLFMSLFGQQGGKNLDSSEKFSLGGATGVRAYPPGEGAGDSGYLASVELRHSFAPDGFGAVLQPFVFMDTGGATLNERPFAAGANSRRLSAAGIGLSWAKAADFQIKLTVAARLGSQRAVSDTDKRTRVWLQASKSF